MAYIKHPDEIAFAGDYNLNNIDLYNHKGQVVDLKNIVIELNIYESIYKNAVTGSIVVTDANNFIGKMEIQGLEKLAFKLETPGVDNANSIDASMETGEPFHVYKITNRKQINQNLTLYTLHFASREFMRNIRTKVSQAFEGSMHLAVMKILLDDDYLDSKRDLFYEPTGNNDKLVIPNISPFAAINMIAQRTLSANTRGVGYYFYETTKGFHFRSWASMCSNKGKHKKSTKQVFYSMPMKVDDPTIDDKKAHEYKSVESYSFLNNFHDVAANTALGTYGHKVITHNLFDKSITEDNYNYHNQFGDTIHADFDGNYGSDYIKYAVADALVDYDDKKNVSDYTESRVSLQSSTRFLHDDDVGSYGINAAEDSRKTGERVSQRNQVMHGTILKLVIKGQSYIQAGDLIEFNVRPIETENKVVDLKDGRFAGNYVVTKIRHKVANNEYKMILECAKDSSFEPLSKGTTRWKTERIPSIVSLYGLDDRGGQE
jgi:hypothetical protein